MVVRMRWFVTVLIAVRKSISQLFPAAMTPNIFPREKIGTRSVQTAGKSFLDDWARVAMPEPAEFRSAGLSRELRRDRGSISGFDHAADPPDAESARHKPADFSRNNSQKFFLAVGRADIAAGADAVLADCIVAPMGKGDGPCGCECSVVR